MGAVNGNQQFLDPALLSRRSEPGCWQASTQESGSKHEKTIAAGEIRTWFAELESARGEYFGIPSPTL